MLCLSGEESLQILDLLQPPYVPFFPGESGRQEGDGDLLGQKGPDDARTEGEHVGIVVLHGLMSGVGVVGEGAPDSTYLIGGDGGARSGATDDDSPFRLSGNHRPGDRGCVVRVIDRIVGVGSQIGPRVTGRGRCPRPLGNSIFVEITLQ